MPEPKHRRRGSIVTRNGVRTVRVYLGKDNNGKRIYVNRTVKGGAKAAIDVLDELLKAAARGTSTIKPSRITVNEMLDRWLEEYAKENCRERTVTYYIWTVDSYIRPKLGKKPVALLTHSEIDAVYACLRREKKLGPYILRTTNAIFSGVFNWAIKQKLAAVNPCTYATLPPLPGKKRRKLSEGQILAFMQAAKSNKWFPLFALAMEIGLRPSEYFGLTWEDINLTIGEITVQRTLLWRKGGNWYFSQPKTEHGYRTVAISEGLRQLLSEHRRKQLEARLKATSYTDNGLVFALKNGRPLRHHIFNRRHFKVVLERAGLPSTTRLYDIRHSSASWQIANGTDARTVSERLGHANVAFTLQTYVESDAKQQKKASEKFAKVLYR